jgi:tRNA-Thr(GGU) m(6)t(6)A37 methyltransferase TsaA
LSKSPDLDPVTFAPIGVVHSPFVDKSSAPRQPAAARDVAGTVELFDTPGMTDAACDLEGWDHLWIVFVFHRAGGFRPKVAPPRSVGRRLGVLATRSPHRPNPIGLSVVRLERVEGLVLHVRGMDMIEGTPVLDVKPYVAYTDAIVDAKEGWLAEADPRPAWDVRFEPAAEAALAFLVEHGVDLRAPVTQALSLGPEPHAYRRIRRDDRGLALAWKDWRARFVVDGHAIVVTAIVTGYRPRQLAEGEAPPVHLAFAAAFG